MVNDTNIPYDLPELPGSIIFNNSDMVDLRLSVRTALGELNGFSYSLPNPLILLSPAIIKESLASSNIENINTTLEEVLQNELFPEAERKEPDKEVLRYRDAVLYAFDELRKIPLSSRIILGIHNKLIPGADSGYRKTQNKIVNSLTQEVLYSPPPANKIPGLIGNWEKFVNDKNDIYDPVIKSIIAHYQFEAIHPFGDGNGRTGRILLLLQLIQGGLLSLPVLYISGYINKNRLRYYEVLRNVTFNKNWKEYIAYMLNTIYLQAIETKQLIFNITELYNSIKRKTKKLNQKIYSSELIDTLFSNPIVTPVKLGKYLNIHYTTASRKLKELTSTGILTEKKIGKYHLYINHELMKIINK